MISMNDKSQFLNRSYGVWPPVPPMQPTKDLVKFQGQPWVAGFGGRSGWKGKKGVDKRKESRRKEKGMMGGGGVCGGGAGAGAGAGGYKPTIPTLNELQSQNRLKARRFYPKKKKFDRFAPFAPRNTTSYLIRAKKAGGIASLVSPSPATPAILPTPMFSPSREILVDTAREEWGVNGYGSMNGLIRLRSPGHEVEGESTDSDVEEHVEVERRLDHDLSRFEMIYPEERGNLLENRVDDQDSHITQLEEENLTLKERLYLMERELVDLRRRLQRLETESRVKEEKHDEESENERGGDVCSEKSVGDGD